MDVRGNGRPRRWVPCRFQTRASSEIAAQHVIKWPRNVFQQPTRRAAFCSRETSLYVQMARAVLYRTTGLVRCLMCTTAVLEVHCQTPAVSPVQAADLTWTEVLLTHQAVGNFGEGENKQTNKKQKGIVAVFETTSLDSFSFGPSINYLKSFIIFNQCSWSQYQLNANK